MYNDTNEDMVLSGNPDFVIDAIDNIDTKVLQVSERLNVEIVGDTLVDKALTARITKACTKEFVAGELLTLQTKLSTRSPHMLYPLSPQPLWFLQVHMSYFFLPQLY